MKRDSIFLDKTDWERLNAVRADIQSQLPPGYHKQLVTVSDAVRWLLAKFASGEADIPPVAIRRYQAELDAALAESMCNCIDEYKDRDMIDPQCMAHDIADAIRHRFALPNEPAPPTAEPEGER